jgi:hypothetical protein
MKTKFGENRNKRKCNIISSTFCHSASTRNEHRTRNATEGCEPPCYHYKANKEAGRRPTLLRTPGCQYIRCVVTSEQHRLSDDSYFQHSVTAMLN